jgi:type I restriction enzyme M protein
VSEKINLASLESYLWGAAVRLRGLIDAGDYKQFIFPLLFLKRISDVYDEEFEEALAESNGDELYALFPENHRFEIPKGAHWQDLRETSANLGLAIQSAMRNIEKANAELLSGIFGDAPWTNKERLSDANLRDLIEHFSKHKLTLAAVPEDELGIAYEYLIKKFADDSGHTAAEFYTNRTVVQLMTAILEPHEGDSIYDPTCGSGGMLLSCVIYLNDHKNDPRTLKLFGQERNLLTSSIARMNLFLHGYEDFEIARGDTLSDPKLRDGDELRKFDVVLANPPYSIKQWDRSKWSSDPFKRNQYGVPPQGRADYAFWQHILASLKPETGRCAILFPHGVLFRDEEQSMREKIVRADLIECIIGLGPNLFYNSPMEACVVICRARKSPERTGKILLINAVDQVTRERASSFLKSGHIDRITKVYQAFSEVDGFARVATTKEIESKGFSLNLPLYVRAGKHQVLDSDSGTLSDAISAWNESALELRASMAELLSRFEETSII